MVAHASLYWLALHVGDDEVGFLHRHAAIDAVVADLWAKLRKFAAIGFLVTLQTLFRIGRGWPFGFVDLVAG